LGIIRKDVMDELLEAEYARENNQDFTDLADVYGGKTTDGRLDDLVRKIHDFMESDPFPQAAAYRYANYFSGEKIDLEETSWAKVVREELMLGLEGAIEGVNQAISVCHMAGGPDKYLQKLEEELEMLEDLLELTTPNRAFADIYKAFATIDWGRLPRITEKDNVDPDLKNKAQSIRDEGVKKRINKLVEGVFFAPPEKMQADLSALAPRVAALMELTMKFSAAFAAEKRARNLLDFSDLEHFAIRILYPNAPEDMTPAQIYDFHEVLIDEYQDSNKVQDLILSAVARRRFMVGDVKQSIYRFRRANPGLFLEKYKQFHDNAHEPPGTRIDLSYNFRSRPEVLDAVNFFFSQLMCEKVGEVEYDNNAALHPGFIDDYPTLPAGTFPEMWVELLDQAEEEPEEGEADEAAKEDEDTPDNVIAETRVIAKCILELLGRRQVWDSQLEAFRPCKPSDIAVLTRGLSSVAGAVLEELKSYGIDAIADMDAGFLQQPEIKTALAFLRVTDNPRQDIELFTVLHSPVYGLTEDELLEISLHPLDSSGEQQSEPVFYDHLVTFAKAAGNVTLHEKVQRFLSDLNQWRNASLYLPISRLIGLIYNMTQYPAYVLMMHNGAIRQANLRLLLERAIEFEETSLRGLFHFINYIVRMYDSDVKSSGAIAEPSPSPEGRVRLMTIHKSKGLEFPVVICAFLGKQFNTDDMRQPVILHSEFGVGPYYVNLQKRTRSNTLARFSLSRLSARENLSEELRCLYVALTRAKELLVLTARSKNLDKAVQKWGNYIGTAKTVLPAYYLSGVKSYLDWLMPCLLRHRSAAEFTTGIDIDRLSPLWNHPANFRIRRHRQESVKLSPLGEFTRNPKIYENYADEPEKTVLVPFSSDSYIPLPSKLSISEIKRLYDITPDSTIITDEIVNFDPPEFIKAKSGPTPMQMGSALHVVTEHLDYKIHTNAHAVENLLTDLTARNLLTHEEAAFIDRAKIETLINSPLAERIRNSSNVYRETPFILALPAAELYPDNPAAQNENVLVHGIIDCYFEENGEIVLVDYKSDAQPTRHTTQMEIYKKAIENATAMKVKEVLIYSFALGKAIPLTASSSCDGK
ncbi:MAG: helicase-exonuclease AddAB subunit AddA, partial [Firmicutes bacterium]|nr:helicase-exonuclease AddAB subunit AddA [Bacillota bacterium]